MGEIKKIKVKSVWIDSEREITAKSDGKKYNICNVNIKVDDSDKEYAGKYVRVVFFEYKDKNDSTKNRSATSKAEYFKTQSEGKEIILEITESESVGKDGITYHNLNGKKLSKKEEEIAAKFIH